MSSIYTRKTRNAYENRQLAEELSFEPLPDLSKKQRFLGRLLGNRFIEKLTKDQMIEATRENVDSIFDFFALKNAKDVSIMRHTNRLWLGTECQELGLKTTVIQTKGDTLTFVDLDDEEGPEPKLIVSPSFTYEGDEMLVDLNSGSSIEPRPLSSLSYNQVTAAYVLTTNALEVMTRLNVAGQIVVV